MGMAEGAYRWQGNWPGPDAARVAEINAAWDGTDAEAFGEPVRAAAVDRIERAQAAIRAGDLTGASDRLLQVRAALDGLNLGALEPRRGLAGLFDGRGGRLKRFRNIWSRAAQGVTGEARELSARVEAAPRRSDALNLLWNEIRDALADLDAHLAVVAARLAGHTPTEDGAPNPLEARRAALDACRTAALQCLPLIRRAQGDDARAAEALRTCADQMAVWRDDWKAALGLSGKRPKRVRPDGVRMAVVRDELMTRMDRALVELAATHHRRSEVENRLAALRRPL